MNTSHGLQCCTADISRGPGQHGSDQRVLTISSHWVLLTHETWATVLFTWSIYFRSSRRGKPLLLALLMPFSTQENTRLLSLWHRGVRVLQSQNDEQNSFSKEHWECLWDNELIHLQPASILDNKHIPFISLSLQCDAIVNEKVQRKCLDLNVWDYRFANWILLNG